MAKNLPNSFRNKIPGLRPIFIWSAYSALLTCFISTYFLKWPLPNLLSNLKALLSVLFLISSISLLGFEILLRAPVIKFDSIKESVWKFLLSFGFGLGVLGVLVFILGWAVPGKFLSLKLLFVIFLLVVIFVLRLNWIYHFCQRKFPLSFSPFSISESGFIMLALPGLLLSFLTCFSPITYYDSLVYHLALPKLYLSQGFIGTVSNNLYSCFPAHMEMLSLMILDLFPEPEYVINLLNWFLAFGTGWALFSWTSEMSSRKWGFLAWALWWTMPAVLFLSVGAYVDIPLAFFTLLSIRCFVQFRKKESDLSFLILSGIFSGVACSIKYTGAMTPLIIGIFLMVGGKKNILRTGKQFLWFGFPLLAIFGFWLTKNTIELGNPFFPFFYKWWGGNVFWTHESASAYFTLLTEYGAKSNIFFEFLLAPWNVATAGLDFGGGFDVLGDFGWPLIILTAPFIFLGFSKTKSLRILYLYSLFHFAFWFFTKPVLRFLVPLLPILIILSTLFIHRIYTTKRSYFYLMMGLVVFPLLVSNGIFYAHINHQLQPFSVPLGFEDKESFLERKLSYFPLYNRINKTLNSKDKLLILGEQRVYHLDIPYLSSNLFAPSQISNWCSRTRSESGLAKIIDSHGITHILINFNEMNRLGGPTAFGFSPSKYKLFIEFVSHQFDLIESYQGINLYFWSRKKTDSY